MAVSDGGSKVPVLSYFEADEKPPKFSECPFSYTQWMEFIPKGITPDGKPISTIVFQNPDDEAIYAGDIDSFEVVGEVQFVGWQFKENRDVFVKFRPGSILICLEPVGGVNDEREGLRIEMCPLP